MTTGRVDWFGDELIEEIQGGSEEALLEAAQELLDAAQGLAPTRTGALRDSGYVASPKKSTYQKRKGHGKERKAPEGMALAGFAMFYAHMVERGTSKMAAKPFLRPALDSAKARVGDRFVIVLAKNVKGKR